MTIKYTIMGIFKTLLLASTATAIALPPADVNLASLEVSQQQQHETRPCSLSATSNRDDDDESPLPVIVWHGLGDSINNEGLKSTADLISEIHPGTYVHLISATSEGDDRSASFFGNVSQQIDLVCAALLADPILSSAPAVDAVGFSQGGQFLRGYIERCNNPPVRSLITFGSQHNGIAEFQRCKSATDFVCHAANALLKSSTVWSDYVQSHLVPAQYYRPVDDVENYLEHSSFLADINNERKAKNEVYKKRLSSLEKFVMVLFKDDKTVIPRESGWFAEKNETSGEVTPLKERKIYKEDWIGLKTLDKKGGLVYEEVEGEHMQLKDKDLKRLFGKYFGPATTQKSGLRQWFEEKMDL